MINLDNNYIHASQKYKVIESVYYSIYFIVIILFYKFVVVCFFSVETC